MPRSDIARFATNIFAYRRRKEAQPEQGRWSQALTLVNWLKSEDPETWAHSVRTWQLMERVGTEMGLFRKYPRDSIRIGCLLHDIGKLGISRSILRKPARLTDDEFAEIKKHCAIGEGMIDGLGLDQVAFRMIRHHHERQDGSGYPDQLRAPQIPDYVRLLAICDCFDALTSDRSYRKAMSIEAALTILRADVATGKLDSAGQCALERVCRNQDRPTNLRSNTRPLHRRRHQLVERVRSSRWNVLRESLPC